VRRGQNATGLEHIKIAELPKDKPLVSSAFFIVLTNWRYRHKPTDYENIKVEKVDDIH
jgi:hypothetical protein